MTDKNKNSYFRDISVICEFLVVKLGKRLQE